MDDYNRMRHEREFGKKEGLAEGEAIGVTKGKVEGKAETTNQIALAMLNEGEPIEKIVKFTGLSVDEIHMLKSLDR